MRSNSPEAFAQLAACAGRACPGINAGDRDEVIEDAVGVVGLTHDLGHPPFSHALEDAFSHLATDWFRELPVPFGEFAQVATAFHEVATVHLLNTLVADLRPADAARGEADRAQYDAFLDLVLKIATADPDNDDWASTLHGVIAGEIDVDRLDYVMRDAQRAGTEFGSVDHVRLINNTELLVTDQHGPKFQLGIGARARSAAETLLIQRAQSYRWIVFHHRVVANNEALARAFSCLVELARSSEAVGDPPDDAHDLRGGFPFDVGSLNYVAPASPNVPSSDQMTLTAGVGRLSHGQDVMSARVDDGMVVQALYDGMVHADRFLEANATVGVTLSVQRVRRFRAYSRAALLREKRLHPAWRTIDEQSRTTAPVLAEAKLRATLAEQVDELRRRYEEHESASLYLSRVASGALRDIVSSDRHQVGLNSAFDVLFGHAKNRRAFEELLSESADSPLRADVGEWAVTYASWSSLKSHGRGATIFVGDRPEPLHKGSPLMAAMQGADAWRLSTMVFYVMCDVDEHMDLTEREVFKNLARATVRRALPTMLTSSWINQLNETASRLSGG